MVYKKYIRKNGKIYGPYIYHSKRVGGKVISEYRGMKEEDNKRNIFLISTILIAIALISALFLNLNLTGNVTFDLQSRINENLELSLSQGELIPLNSKIRFTTSEGQEKEYLLSELTTSNISEGKYYLQGKSLDNSGEGIGTKGQKEITPTVYFKYEIIEKKNSPTTTPEYNETPAENTLNKTEENNSEINNNSETDTSLNETENTKTEIKENDTIETSQKETSSEPSEEPAPETNSANQTSPETTTVTTSPETSSETITKPEPLTSETTSTEETPGITGAITGLISRINPTGNTISNESTSGEIQADVTKGESFEINLKENQEIRIIEESIRTEKKELNNSVINLEIISGKAIITTNYSEIEEGFGEEFIGEEIKIPLNKSKINPENNSLSKIELIIEESNEILIPKNPAENETNPNETPELNTTKENETIIPPEINDTQPSNITLQENVTLELNETSEINYNVSALEEFIGPKNFSTELSKYRDKTIVSISLAEYTREFSYSQSLTQEELIQEIEKDKQDFIRDLLSKFTEEKFKQVKIN